MKTFLLVIITLCMVVTCFNVNDLRTAYVKGPSVVDFITENINTLKDTQ